MDHHTNKPQNIDTIHVKEGKLMGYFVLTQIQIMTFMSSIEYQLHEANPGLF